MRKRIYLLFFLILGAVSFTHCVSPHYGTARIQPGLNFDGGIAFNSSWAPAYDISGYSLGIRGDAEVGYGVGSYLRPYARAALGVNLPIPFGDGGVGLQAALPLGKVTPAVRIELSSYVYSPGLTGTVLLGIGEAEKVTLGARTLLIGFEPGAFPENMFLDAFCSYHLSSRGTIFIGLEVRSVILTLEGQGYPIGTVGIGYRFFPKKK